MAPIKDTGNLSRDGTFLIEYSSGWAYLTVKPPLGGGRPVYSEVVFARMKILGVSAICAEAVSDIVSRAEGRAEKLIEWPQGVELSAKPVLSIAEDGMSAMLSLRPPKKGGGVPTTSEICALLSDSGIVSGIRRQEIESLSGGGVYDVEVVVAEGQPPTHGLARRTEYLFEGNPGKPYIFRKDGSTNLRELNFVQNKKKGDVLARILPAVAAEAGVTIFGDTVAAVTDGPDAEIVPGDNTSFSDSRNEILALIDGNVFIERNMICIEPVVNVRRVNYETGNIHFDGSVVVREGISDGFTIEAGGTVEIGECVGRATVTAGRDVLLKGGMNGDGEGTIRAVGDIASKYIENARISCGGHLFVQELLLHTDFVVGSNLVLRGRRGELLGGNGIVGNSLWCKQLGSKAEVLTRISLGIEPAVLNAYMTLKASVEEKSTELDKVRFEILSLENLLSNADDRREKVILALRQQRERAEELGAECKALKRDLRQSRSDLVPSAGAMAVVEGNMHPRSVIAFGEEEFRPDGQVVSKTVLRFEGGRIVEGGYNPSEPPDFPVSLRSI